MSTDFMAEEESDFCMSLLKGVEGKYPPCSIEKCWDKMTLSNQVLFVPNHQILWFQFGDKVSN